MGDIAHKELVRAGLKWLINNGCRVAFSEITSAANETPDIIGFRYNQSVLIEVKISRSDFLADKKKIFRQFPEKGMGNSRYYLAPRGLLKIEDMPVNWSLIEYKNGRIYGDKTHLRTDGKWWQESNLVNEKILLQSVCRRLASRFGNLDSILHEVNDG